MPYEQWETHLHALEDSLREFYDVGESMIRHQDDGHPMLIIVVTGTSREEMTSRLHAVNQVLLDQTT